MNWFEKKDNVRVSRLLSIEKWMEYLCMVHDVSNSPCARRIVLASNGIVLDMFGCRYHKQLLLSIHYIRLPLLYNWISASAREKKKQTQFHFGRVVIEIFKFL